MTDERERERVPARFEMRISEILVSILTEEKLTNWQLSLRKRDAIVVRGSVLFVWVLSSLLV